MLIIRLGAPLLAPKELLKTPKGATNCFLSWFLIMFMGPSTQNCSPEPHLVAICTPESIMYPSPGTKKDAGGVTVQLTGHQIGARAVQKASKMFPKAHTCNRALHMSGGMARWYCCSGLDCLLIGLQSYSIRARFYTCCLVFLSCCPTSM